jgi:membrane fusion protein (multidrug efflux system)
MLLLSLAAACSESESSASPPAMPPTAVSVVEVKPQAVPIVNDLPGRIAPTQIAEVRPRVSGILIKRVFEQGSMVKEGDILYQIDPAPFQVQVESAKATLQRAQGAQLLARQQADRQKDLQQKNIASMQDLDSAIAQLAQADADVAAAKAGLDAAELNLQYASVKAPISGRIGRALITEGALVNASGAENLATIQQLDPVYADFTQSSQALMALKQALKKGLLQSPAAGEASVRLLFDDGTEYPQPGRLLFSEATVDEMTGQVTMRAEFPNPDGDLLPGLYVRILIEQAVEQDALTVPQQAVQRDTAGHAQLYVVGKDNVAELRTVVIGRIVGDQAVVTKGLQAGDRVVVEGFQKLRPGATVAPADWKPAPAATSSSESEESAG